MARSSALNDALRMVREVALRTLRRGSAPAPRHAAPRKGRPPVPLPGAYPGDFTGPPNIAYQPNPDGNPDPGEIVWTWVPFEEDPREGKDRPVLLIGRDGPWLLGLQVTSQDHDVDAAQEASAGRFWMDIGTGDWDRKRRPSEVRVNRIVRIDPGAVRRIGAILDSRIFAEVTREVLRHY